MIVFASVDLSDPLGPMSAWTSPRSTFRSTPRRISLPSTVTCRFWISRSAIGNASLLLWSLGGCRAHARPRPRAGRAGSRWGDDPALGERGQLGEGRLLERPLDAALDAGPEQLRGAVLVSVELVVAEHPARAEVAHALH